MTPDDAQIDVLMRRYASQAEPSPAGEHLDADELNAFAEGSLPPAARSSYISHLAGCDDCRKLATQLTIAASVSRPELAGSGAVATESLWRKLTAFFVAPAFRYAAFAAVLALAAGLVFFSMRQPRGNSALVAQQDAPPPTAGSAVERETTAGSQATPNASTRELGEKSETLGHQPDSKTFEEKSNESKSAADAPSLPKTDGLIAAEKTAPPVIAKKAEPYGAPASPSYAPPPPGESQSAGSVLRAGRDEREGVSGPRKGGETDLDKLKTIDRTRAGDMAAKDSRAEDDSRGTRNQNVQNRAQQKESPRPSGPMLSRNQQSTEMNRNQQTNDIAGNATTGASRVETEKPPETRSAGGHKFRRQGSAWVDTKFKSSMSIINVARGSDEFRALDSSVRSMADQFAGEVIVVSNGKAYRIH